MSPKVSIIIPIYKSEAFIYRCLDSILIQTFQDFEVLLIDDGSPDKSGEICEEYARRDRRFRVFHKENGGVSSARNLGLDYALGEWIYFVDSDDMLFEDTLDVLFSKTSKDIDSVVGGYLETDGINVLYTTSGDNDMLWNYKTALIDFYSPIYCKFNGYLWNRLFRHSIIKDFQLFFHNDIYYKEDGLFVVEFLCKSLKNVCVTTKCVYKYYLNPNGAMLSLKRHFDYRYLTNMDARIACWENIKSVTNWSDFELRFKSKRCIVQMYDTVLYLLAYHNIQDEIIKNNIYAKMRNHVSLGFIRITKLYDILKRIYAKIKYIRK